MRCFGVLCFLLAAFVLVGCSSPLLPAPVNPSPSRQQQGDADLLGRLESNWQLLSRRSLPARERALALHQYNKDLLLLLRRLRWDSAELPPWNILERFDVRHQLGDESLRLLSLYDEIIPAADVELSSLQERYTTYGLGVPMVGVIPASKIAQSRDKLFNIATRGTVTSITAVLQFPRKGKPQLLLLPRQQVNDFRVAAVRYELAADWSALLEVYWGLTRVKDDRILGLLRPQKLRSTTGLSTIEPYDPDKIPVILTHGLASSAGTFDNLVNRLLAEPSIRKNYQFWYFNYPTGVAWTISARSYRDALHNVRNRVDPRRQNPNWNHMVVVGHSMGGLITHYSQCEQPWKLLLGTDIPEKRLKAYLQPKYVDEPFQDARLEPLRKDYFFKPVEAGMVVYMATPHRGAPLANYSLVTLLTKLVTLPQTILKEAYNIATLQNDIFLLNPQDAYKWFISVNQLNPDSYSIKGLQGLKVRNVPTHSIIGNDGDGSCPKCTDGVVPYWSSHIAWGTENVVPSDHSVQDCLETADIMKDLLRQYSTTHPAVRSSVKHKLPVRPLYRVLPNHRAAAVKKSS